MLFIIIQTLGLTKDDRSGIWSTTVDICAADSYTNFVWMSTLNNNLRLMSSTLAGSIDRSAKLSEIVIKGPSKGCTSAALAGLGGGCQASKFDTEPHQCSDGLRSEFRDREVLAVNPK